MKSTRRKHSKKVHSRRRSRIHRDGNWFSDLKAKGLKAIGKDSASLLKKNQDRKVVLESHLEEKSKKQRLADIETGGQTKYNEKLNILNGEENKNNVKRQADLERLQGELTEESKNTRKTKNEEDATKAKTDYITDANKTEAANNVKDEKELKTLTDVTIPDLNRAILAEEAKKTTKADGKRRKHSRSAMKSHKKSHDGKRRKRSRSAKKSHKKSHDGKRRKRSRSAKKSNW
jgi:hypothetical protein